jgi:protease-4
MSQTDVEQTGTLWSGSDAAGIGLVDAFGGLNDAVKEAASLAGLETYRVIERPVAVDFYTRLLKEMMGDVRSKIVTRELGEAARYYYDLKEIISSGGVQAVMPCYIDIY